MKKVQKKAPVGKIPAPLTREQEIEATESHLKVEELRMSDLLNNHRELEKKISLLKSRRSDLKASLEYEARAKSIALTI